MYAHDLTEPPIRRPRRRPRLIGLSLAAAALATAAPATAAPAQAPAASEQVADRIKVTVAPDASAQFRAVVAKLAQALEASRVPGAALGITIDGRDEVATFGVGDLTTRAPVSERSRFAIGSVTKTFTGTAIMRLVDQGRIDLDAPVRRYVPELRLADESVAREVTVRHLMTHTGNWWGDGFVDTGTGEDAIARFVKEHLPRAPQLAPLGQLASYSNSGFVLLGLVVERVTGKPFRAAIAELVLEPLHMRSTTLDPRVVRRGPRTTGYGDGAGGLEPVTPAFLPRSIDPAGGMWSTIRDQLRYVRFHLGDGSFGGRRVISKRTMELMRRPAGALPDGAELGLYWPIVRLPGGERLLTHTGQTFTHIATVGLVPERRFGVALLLNSTTGGGLPGSVINDALRTYLDVGSVAPPKPPDQPLEPSPEELREYTGRYDSPTDTFVLRARDGVLTFTDERHNPPWQVIPSNDAQLPDLPLVFLDEDLAQAGSGPEALPIRFLRKANGRVGWLSISGRLFPKLD